MKSALAHKAITAALVISLFVPAAFFAAPPQPAQAISGCIATALSSLGIAKVASKILSVPTSDSITQTTTGGNFVAKCILEPIAVQMARTMARNISNSIVNWINNDFNGKPSFITNINGTITDSADETIGNFIYGSDLQFLCQPFAFQIRLALATKYTQPFQQQIRCSLSDVANNAKNFANNNGGAGWNNWLQITTEPQNNVYGAYLMADSELASNIQSNLDKVNNELTWNNGFLGFKVCEKWDDPAKSSGIIAANASAAGSNQLVSGGSAFNSQSTLLGQSTQGNGQGLSGQNMSVGSQTFAVPGQSNTVPTFNNASGDAVGPQKICESWKTTTPGAMVASQATKVLGGWADQLNLAQDLDQIIGALVSHFADKMVSGAQGFLGLSGNGGYASNNLNYTLAQQLANDPNNPDNAGLAEVNATADAGISAVFPATTVSAGENIAIGKPVAMSFPGVGSSAWITDGDVTTAASTAGTANPWMEIDMGAMTAIDEVHVWSPAGVSATDALGTFDVVVSNTEGGRDWVSDPIVTTDASTNPIVVPVNQTGEFIRVERINNAAVAPLNIAEIEVIAPSTTQNAGTTGDAGAPAGSTGTSGVTTANGTAPSVSLGPVDGPASIAPNTPVLFTVPVNASAPITIATLDIRLYKDSNLIGFNSVFTNGAVGKKQSGVTVNYYPGAAPGITFANVPAGGSSNSAISVSGSAIQSGGAYKALITARDSTGNILGSASIDFIVQ